MASPVILLNLWSLDLRAQPLEIKGDGEKRGRKGRKRKEGGRGGDVGTERTQPAGESLRCLPTTSQDSCRGEVDRLRGAAEPGFHSAVPLLSR